MLLLSDATSMVRPGVEEEDDEEEDDDDSRGAGISKCGRKCATILPG